MAPAWDGPCDYPDDTPEPADPAEVASPPASAAATAAGPAKNNPTANAAAPPREPLPAPNFLPVLPALFLATITSRGLEVESKIAANR